jgi:hypothetical protein
MTTRPRRKARAGVALVLVLGLAVVAPQPAAAQIPVIDIGQIIQLARVIAVAYRTYQQAALAYNHLVVMSAPLANMMGFKMYPAPVTYHSWLAQSRYANPLFTALNYGDARGQLLMQVLRLVGPLNPMLTKMPWEMRESFERAYANLEVADSMLQRTIHVVGAGRTYMTGELARSIQQLEDDTLNPHRSWHQPTASMDKIAAGELIAARQQMQHNIQLSALVELEIRKQMEQRDMEADDLNQRLGVLRHPDATDGLIDDSAAALDSWRQP